MAIFQKIAASSFAAVRRTLRRRLLALTIHEGLLRDQDLDVDGREHLFAEARTLIHEEYDLPHDAMSRGEVDRIFADMKYRVLRRIDSEELASLGDPDASEVNADAAEEFAGAIDAQKGVRSEWRIGGETVAHLTACGEAEAERQSAVDRSDRGELEEVAA
jgi:hypothetical protein